MMQAVKPGSHVRAFAGAMLIAGSLLMSAQLAAQADQPPSDEQRKQQLAEILYQHSDIDPAARETGAAIFQDQCAACHDGGVSRAPTAAMLAGLTPEAVMRVLTDGAMKEQGAALDPVQKQAVSEFVTGRRLALAGGAPPLMCASSNNWFDLDQPPTMAGWGLDANNGHYVPDAVAGLGRAKVGQLRLKWALAFPGLINARSQPTIAGGAIFIGSETGTVYALDPATGCAHWTFSGGPVRMGLAIDTWQRGDRRAAPRIYFGDMSGNAYALDARTGALVWRQKIDPHPNATLTATPALFEGALYFPISSLEEPAAAVPTHECCTFRSSIVALDTATGGEKWRTFMVDEPRQTGVNANGVKQFGPSGVAIWSTPLVDPRRRQVYVTTGDNYSAPATELSDAIVALNLDSGKINWAYQALAGDIWNVSCGWVEAGNCPEDEGPDFDFGAPPVMAQGGDGNDYLMAGQKSGAVYALDPASGELRWTKRVGRGGVLGGIHFGLSAANGVVFVPVSDFPDGQEHSLSARPGLFALDAASGDYVWKVEAENACSGKRFCEPGYGAPVTITDQMVLAGSTDGYLRIFDAANGQLLWELDTDRDYRTVNGTLAHGGSMSGGSAPIVWNGMLIVNSGYGSLGKMPGNVLLVFEAE